MNVCAGRQAGRQASSGDARHLASLQPLDKWMTIWTETKKGEEIFRHASAHALVVEDQYDGTNPTRSDPPRTVLVGTEHYHNRSTIVENLR